MAANELALRNQANASLEIYADPAKFEHALEVARTFSKASLVPKHFQGEENVSNCLIALQFCFRIKEDPFMVMQKLYVVHGRLGLETQLAIALVNRSGVFVDDISWEPNGETGDKFGYYAIAKKHNGKECRELCTVDMAKKKGWWGKDGSNWPSMTELMLKYRSALMLARLHCPDVLMGMYTVSELKDVGEAEIVEGSARVSVADLDAALCGDPVPAEIVSPQEAEKAPEPPLNVISSPSEAILRDWAKNLSKEDKARFKSIATGYKETMGELQAAQQAYADMMGAAAL